MNVLVKHIGADKWEAYLPARKAAIKGMPPIRPRRIVHAENELEAKEAGEKVLSREYIAWSLGATMDVASLALTYIAHAEALGIYTADTAHDYRSVVFRYIEPYLASDADEVTAVDMETYYAFMLSCGGKDGNGISPKTIRKINTVLRATFKFLVREGITQTNPLLDVSLPKLEDQAKRILTEREFACVMNALEEILSEDPTSATEIKQRNCAFGAWANNFIGARVGEVCAIMRGNVFWAEGNVLLDGSMSERGGLHRKTPKTKAGTRKCPPGQEFFEGLKKHWAWQETYLSSKQCRSDTTPLCTTARGGFIRPSDMSEAFKKIALSAGVDLGVGESFHILRHTNATYMLSNKFNPVDVQHRLGHTRFSTTADNYGHAMSTEDALTGDEYSEVLKRYRQGGSAR